MDEMESLSHTKWELNEGVEEWNQWRERNPAVGPDLSKANFRKAELTDAYLSRQT